MTKQTALKAAKNTGKGLGFVGLCFLTALAASGEEAERQRKIQEHVTALNDLEPNAEIVLIKKY